MAAFTAKDPYDEAAFAGHWRRIRSDASITNRTIVHDGEIVGHIGSFADEGRREITYWIAPARWGCGYARPLYARVAADNLASFRILAKHGYARILETMSHANAPNAVIAETLLELL